VIDHVGKHESASLLSMMKYYCQYCAT